MIVSAIVTYEIPEEGKRQIEVTLSPEYPLSETISFLQNEIKKGEAETYKADLFRKLDRPPRAIEVAIISIVNLEEIDHSGKPKVLFSIY